LSVYIDVSETRIFAFSIQRGCPAPIFYQEEIRLQGRIHLVILPTFLEFGCDPSFLIPVKEKEEENFETSTMAG
jgi:hypothetical protein